MVNNPGEFRHDHPDVFGTLRWGYFRQLFDGGDVAEVVTHRREVIQPVGKGYVADPGIPFADLFMISV